MTRDRPRPILDDAVMGARLVVRSLWSDAEPTFEYAFDQERIVIGRQSGADVLIPHPAVSLHHATIGKEGSRYVATDQSSTNGTYVNGERLAPGRAKALKRGDVIDCGGFRIDFEGPVPVVAATSEHRTASLARRIVREALSVQGVGTPEVVVIRGPDYGQALILAGPPARLTLGVGHDVDLRLTKTESPIPDLEIEADLDGYVIRSKNEVGFLVGDVRLCERRLRHGDEISLGKTGLRFEDPAETAVRDFASRGDEVMDAPRVAISRPPSEAGSPGDDPSRPAAPARRPTSAPPTRGLPGTDLVIYVLAGAVLVLSIAALVVLLQT